MIPFREIPEPQKRRKLSLSEKVAACLVKMTGPDGNPLVEAPETKSVREILSAVQWDHLIPLEIGGTDHPTNIWPLRVKQHVEEKTPADQKKIKRARHNRNRELLHREIMTAKAIGDDLPRDIRRNRIASRPFQKGHRPLKGRGFERRQKSETRP